MDNKQFGVYVLIVAAVVLIAVGFNNITGQVSRTCEGNMFFEAVPVVGGAYFKVKSDLSESFRNNIDIKNAGRTYRSYTATFNECGNKCSPSTLAENDGIIMSRFKQLPAGDYVAVMKNPCSGKEIESFFTVR